MLTEYLPLPGDTPVIFWHPKVPKKLTVPTGVSGIGWDYELNTKITPSFGGEVVQVLSSFIGPLTVHGQTRDNKQVRDIYSWFVYYMQIAGLRARNEEYVVMDYPTRGWSFWIMPNQLPEFVIHRDRIAVEWTVTAEVVSDDASSYDVLKGHTMAGFYEASFDPHMFDVGFKGYNDPRNVDQSDIGDAASRIGDNMQSLIGAWASGDFMHFAVDIGHTPGRQQDLKPANEYWSQILGGSDILIGGSKSGSQSLAGSFGGGEPVGRVQNAGAIASAFEAAGIPGELAVASAIVESNLNPNARQSGGDSAMGLFQSFPTGAAGGQRHRSEVVAAFNNQSQSVTKYWPASHQIIDAVGWWSDKKPVTNPQGEWAKRAQGAGDPSYAQKVNAAIPDAKDLIKQYQKSGGAWPGAVVNNALWGIQHEPAIHYSQSGARLAALNNPRQLPLNTDCSAFAILCYKWANAPDPTGAGFVGNSVTLYQHMRHISQNQAQPGDLVDFGAGGSEHTAIIISTSPMILCSHGGESGPLRISLADEAPYHSGPITFLTVR